MSGYILEGCPTCDHGWRAASEDYVARLFPMPGNATEIQIESVWALRELYPTHLFPCPDCRPEAFARWANGCMRPGHRASKCELCIEQMGKKGAGRVDRSAARASGRPVDDF